MKNPNTLPDQPILPPQLKADFDASAQAVFDTWQAKSLETVKAEFTPATTFENGDKSIQYATVEPKSGEVDPESTVFMALPAGKTWTPETFITASVVHDLVAPDGRLIVLPNNNRGDVAYTLSKDERKQVAAGDYSSISERQVRLVEALGEEALALVMGHSLGATLGASFGNAASSYLQLRANMFNEAPNSFTEGRSAGAIRKSVLREKDELVPAYRGIGLPALSEAINLDKKLQFQLDLLRFAVGSNLRRPNVAINSGFKVGGFAEDVSAMLAQSEAATVLLTNANSSTVSSADELAAFAEEANAFPGDEVARHDTYDGYHVTAGNPFVTGLLARRALQWHDQVQRAGRDFGSIGERHTEAATHRPRPYIEEN